jgi:hypothetical protein
MDDTWTVADLIEKLQTLNPEAEVYIDFRDYEPIPVDGVSVEDDGSVLIW